jgi:hypothetical protein
MGIPQRYYMVVTLCVAVAKKPEISNTQDVERVCLGKKIRAEFKDSEKMIGYTQGYSPNRVGFILFPSDPDSNNEKAFIINSATDNIRFI